MNAPGRVHLVGGGRDEEALAPLFAAFVADAAAAGGSDHPRVCVLLVLEDDDDETVDRFRRMVARAGADAVVHAVTEGEVFAEGVIEGANGLVVGGGLTPAYLAAFAHLGSRVRSAVLGGIPYLGFSAGAAIAATPALIGGFAIDGVTVCDPDAGEELDEVTVVEGLGLVPFAVDVHAAQWGTLSRLIAAGAAGVVDTGVALDEGTAIVVRAGEASDRASTAGEGAAWHVTRDDAAPGGSVRVRRSVAG